MIKFLGLLLFAFILLGLFALTPITEQASATTEGFAQIDPTLKGKACEGTGDPGCTTSGGLNNVWKSVLDAITYIVGGVAILMLVIGGLRYVISGGDSNSVQGAKNTILYAIIGLIVAISAQLIVFFVISETS